jgi:peptidoglycan/LPS O-acetylase OafA/YrhL
MVIIIQFYVLFPLLLWPARRFAWFRRTLPLWGLLIQAGFYVYRHWFGSLPNSSDLCVTYFSYFAFGGWLGMYYEQARAFIVRSLGWLIPLGIVLGLAYTALFVLDQYQLASFENTWYELFRMLYGCASGVCLIGVALWLQRRDSALSPWLKSLGLTSFGVYLMHPWILSTWKVRIAEPGSVLGYNLYYLGAFALTLQLPWLAALAYKRAASLLRGRQSLHRRSAA